MTKEHIHEKDTQPVSTTIKRARKTFPIFKILLGLCLVVLFLAWAIIPAIRGYTLVENKRHFVPQATSTSIPVQDVQFQAIDGVRLSGWLVLASPKAPTIILVHGFKENRMGMLPDARFLYQAGYNVLLYDSRGCGASDGWSIALGAREPDDVLGAVRYLKGRSDLLNKHFGLMGNSLGAGIVLLAAAREPAILATVADSSWIDEHAQLDRMYDIPVGRLTLPLLPYEPALVDQLIGAKLADTRPLAVIHQIAPRAVFLIHSADDQNATTPPSGEHQLFAAAGVPKQEWIAPSGGHTGALKAHPQEYTQRVLSYFAHYL